jgi:hypothetical protein
MREGVKGMREECGTCHGSGVSGQVIEDGEVVNLVCGCQVS